MNKFGSLKHFAMFLGLPLPERAVLFRVTSKKIVLPADLSCLLTE